MTSTVYGAYAYELQIQMDNGPIQGGSVGTNRFDTTWAFANSKYCISVRAVAGENQLGGWTSTLCATATPQLANPPQNVRTYPNGTGMTITWDPPTGQYTDSIQGYQIIIWDYDATCAFISGAFFTSSPAYISG